MRPIVPLLVLALNATSAVAAPTIGGCPMFPANNIWNTAVDNAAADANSAAYVATIGAATHVHPDFGTPPGGKPFRMVIGFDG